MENTIRAGLFFQIMYENHPKYKVLHTRLLRVDHSEVKAFHESIIQDLKTKEKYRVTWWKDSADFGIYPDENEQLPCILISRPNKKYNINISVDVCAGNALEAETYVSDILAKSDLVTSIDINEVVACEDAYGEV